MKRINIDFKVEKNGKLVKVQSEESVPTKTSELENDSGFITQAPETAIDNQTITKNSTNELQTIGVKYNDNLITAEMIYNATHYIRYKEDEPTPPTPTGEAGLYVNGVLTKTWAQLLSDGDITITDGALNVSNYGLAGDLVCDNVEGLTILSQAFAHCTSLTSIDTSKLDTSNVTTMFNMFAECTGLTSLDVSGFNTSNVTSMTNMFGACSSLTILNLSNFNTSNVTKMLGMFTHCTSLTSLDISSFTFDKVISYNDMFANIPSDCEILVKSQTEKDWITSKFTNLTNVKIKGTHTDGGSNDNSPPDIDWGL